MPSELFSRTSTLVRESIDEASRSVRAIVATHDPVFSVNLRTGEAVLEVLHMDGVQLPSQMPLLDTHMMGSVRTLLGSIRNLEVASGQLTGQLFVSAAEEAIWTKIREGHIQDISVGRRAFEQILIPPGSTRVVRGIPYTAPVNRSLAIVTRWQPIEGSLTNKGSDPRAKIL